MGDLSFQNPAAFLWAIPLMGVIVALYLLRMRRRDVKVPASFLWPDKVEEIRANSLFQKLRFSWLLVLQLLAVAAVVTALARPQSQQHGLAGAVTVFVLDSSASMGATDVKPTRFDDAKRQIAEAIRGAKVGDRIALIEAGPQPRVIFPLGGDPSRQLREFDSVQGTDAESDVGEALRLAAALVGGLDGARIVLLSDGCFNPVEDFSPGKAVLAYRQVGQAGENLAISALGVSDTANGRMAYCGVRNFGVDARQATVTINVDGKLLDSVALTVAGGKTWGHTVRVPADAKVLSAALDAPGDLLSADNIAFAHATAGGNLRVLLVSPGDFFLERALVLDPRVTLDKTTKLPDTEKGTGPSNYDLIVFDGMAEEPVRARGVLTLGVAGPSSPVKKIGISERPRFIDSKDSPVMRGVQLEGTYIEKAEKVQPAASAEVLAESNDGPLIVFRPGKKRQVYVAFSPMESDLPLQVSFPILIANLLTAFGSEEASDSFIVRAGQPFAVAALGGKATLEGPLPHSGGGGLGRGSVEIPASDGSAMVREVKRAGNYTLSLDDKKRPVYAQLRSDRESSIDPIDQLKLGGGDVKAISAPARFADFWKPLIALCLLILAGEWWLFARRS